MAQNQSPPAHYHPHKAKTYSPMFTLKEREKKCYFDPSKEVLSKPLPGTYNPKEKQTKPSRFNNIGLGYGEKYLGVYTPYKPKPQPGPGYYIKDFSWVKSARGSSRTRSNFRPSLIVV